MAEVLAQGDLKVSNSPSRVEALVQKISNVIDDGETSSILAEQICGRLGFASAQLFAKSGAAALWHLRAVGSVEGSRRSRVRCQLRWSVGRRLDREPLHSIAPRNRSSFLPAGFVIIGAQRWLPVLGRS